MTEIILSSLLSLFALYGKGGDVDRESSKKVLANYIRRHFGIRDTDYWLNWYEDMRDAYSMTENLDMSATVDGICTNLHGKIESTEETMMVLRLMEFCAVDGLSDYEMELLHIVANKFHVNDEIFQDFLNFVLGRECSHVRKYTIDGLDGELKTLLVPTLHRLVFVYLGKDELLLNDVPVLSGSFQVMQKSGVLKSHHCQPIYYSTLYEAFNSADQNKNKQKVEFCGRNINFRFPNSDNGMHDLSFTLKSGELLAIMGGSGTGKSTLLSLLNGGIVPQSGTITINGHSIQEPQAKSLIGYVPQDDLLIEELTVRENLLFTARLCFEGMSSQEIEKRVDRVLRDLGLDATRDLKVGSAINKYISGGQRKRLNIALELIREPAVLFLDEPTSGLSSADTEKVINLLKEQTYRGKLIIVNIHQPSSDVYKLFDRLWLLDKGGYPVFDGNPIDAITYFKTAANYVDSETSACPTCGNVNPEIVLNIIDEKALNEIGETSDQRKTTPQEWHKLYLESRDRSLEAEDVVVTPIPPSDQKRPNPLKQFVIFLHRNICTKITNLQYITMTLLVAPLLAVICAFLTRYAPATGYTLLENKNFVSYVFMAVIVATFIGMSGSAEEIIRDRALLKRERFLRLSYSSYIASKIVYSAFISLLQTGLFVLIGNAIMGVSGLFMVWWGVLFSVSLLSNFIGLLLSQCLNSIVAIYISIPLLLIPQILLCGVVVDFNDLTPSSTTGNVPVLGNAIPSRWAYEALAVTNYTDNKFESDYFDYDREKYETQFYINGFLYELESQIESARDEERRGNPVKPEHLITVRNSLPIISSYTGQEPYSGDYGYDSLHQYFQESRRILSERGNIATLAADRKMAQRISNSSKEEQFQLKQQSMNAQLRDIVQGAKSPSLVTVVNGYIVPRAGQVYLKPLTNMGNAPFYSSTKVLGSWQIKTLWFNLGVLYLMCLFLGVLLFCDFPGRLLRKEND